MTDYEQLLGRLQARRSIRSFAEHPVPRSQIDLVLEAARWAPSNHNRQPWKFLVLDDRKGITQLAGDVGRELDEKLKNLPAIAAGFAADLRQHAVLFQAAPVVVVAWHKKPVQVAAALLENVPQPDLVSGEPLSVAMAVQNLLLAAHALGLGACVLTAPLLAPAALAARVGRPPGFEFNCLVALGYPAEAPPAPRRKSLDQIKIHWDNARIM